MRTGGQDGVSLTCAASIHSSAVQGAAASAAQDFSGLMERMGLEGAGSAQPATEPAGAHEDVYRCQLQTSSRCRRMAASCCSAATETRLLLFGLEVNLSFPRISNISEAATSCVSGPFCGKPHIWRQCSA